MYQKLRAMYSSRQFFHIKSYKTPNLEHPYAQLKLAQNSGGLNRS